MSEREIPTDRIDFHAFAPMGKAVIAMPCTNPSIGPVLTITSHGDLGWYFKLQDGFGTVLWDLQIAGLEDAAG